MPKRNSPIIAWLPEPVPQDYVAAGSYLELLHPAAKTRKVVEALKRAPMNQFKAKDIFRASRLSLLGVSNSHVENDREKIKGGQKLSPLLLVRNEVLGIVVIADGYHRLCAIYGFDEDAVIPCKIV